MLISSSDSVQTVAFLHLFAPAINYQVWSGSALFAQTCLSAKLEAVYTGYLDIQVLDLYVKTCV